MLRYENKIVIEYNFSHSSASYQGNEALLNTNDRIRQLIAHSLHMATGIALSMITIIPATHGPLYVICGVK